MLGGTGGTDSGASAFLSDLKLDMFDAPRVCVAEEERKREREAERVDCNKKFLTKLFPNRAETCARTVTVRGATVCTPLSLAFKKIK